MWLFVITYLVFSFVGHCVYGACNSAHSPKWRQNKDLMFRTIENINGCLPVA